MGGVENGQEVEVERDKTVSGDRKGVEEKWKKKSGGRRGQERNLVRGKWRGKGEKVEKERRRETSGKEKEERLQ